MIKYPKSDIAFPICHGPVKRDVKYYSTEPLKMLLRSNVFNVKVKNEELNTIKKYF